MELHQILNGQLPVAQEGTVSNGTHANPQPVAPNSQSNQAKPAHPNPLHVQLRGGLNR